MGNGFTLAIADDDEAHAELLSAWLGVRGCRVLRFASGDELLAWAETSPEPVDAFLLDVDMPGRDGFESCRALRGIPVFAETPLVFVSSMAEELLAPRARASGGTGAFSKDARLLDTLGGWLDGMLEPAA